jgi:hypothetical protein
MTTAQDLIKQAYQDIGVLGRGKAMSAFLAQSGLDSLNQMLGMWSNEPFMIPSRTSEDLTFTSSANSYTIGSGGDFDVTRPDEILDGYLRAGGTDYPIRIFTQGEYNDISYKATGNIPSAIYYEPSYPLGVIYLDCQPAVGHILHINSYKPLTSFAALTTAVSLPEGYEAAIRFNLALMLAPANGKTPSPIVVGFAQSSKDNIKTRRASQRVPVSEMPSQLSGGRRYNAVSDGYK